MDKEEIRIVTFDMKYLIDYYNGFNLEITKYQWPDPFVSVEDAKSVLQGFLDEMERGETLFFAVLTKDDRFIGSVEIHGLSGECPELGIWITGPEQKKGYAYEALNMALGHARSNYHKKEFYYEADVRNIGSMKLLQKLDDQYEIIRQELEETKTDSGKELRLQGFILRIK